MPDNFFKSIEELKEAFRIDGHSEYTDYTPYNKGIGFSLQRSYPSNGKYKPPIKKNREPDTVALIGVLYQSDRINSKTPNLVPISLKISAYSKYLRHRDDYNFEEEECPTKASVIASKITPKPIALFSFDGYFYDHRRDSFIDSKGNLINGVDIIDNLFRDHLSTVSTIRGFVLRFKLGSTHRVANIFEFIAELFKRLLEKIYGRTIGSDDDFMRIGFFEYRPEDMKLLNTESIEIFGYKASKNVIVIFCIIILGTFFGFKITGHVIPKCIKTIAENNFLDLCAGILSIFILNDLLPLLFLKIVNMMNRAMWGIIKTKTTFKGLRVQK